MKRLALALLLLATPAWGGTYWVSPVGNAANDGSDSTKNAKTLAWANAYATAGDTIYLKSSFGIETDTTGGGGIPQYNQPIRPTHGGSSNSARIWFIGDVNHPGSRKVTYVELDTVAGCTGYVSVYGVRAEKTTATNGGLIFRGRHATYDSVAYCKIDGKLDVFGRNYSTICHSVINDGLPWPRSGTNQTMSDLVNITNGMQTGDLSVVQALPDSMNGWLHGFTFTDNTVRSSIGLGRSGNAMTVRLVKSSTFARDTFYLGSVLVPPSGSSDAHLNTWYLCQDNDVTDCVFYGKADGTYSVFYLLNVRDYQIGNRWTRNKFIEDEDSAKPLKVAFLTAGASDPGDRNNTWTGNFVRVRGLVEIETASKGEIHQFNTYLTQDEFWFGGNVTTARADSLIFRHNTLVNFNQDAEAMKREYNIDSTKASRINRNIFAGLKYSPTSSHIGNPTAYGHYAINAFGTADEDSNLFWCHLQDSTLAVRGFTYGPSTPSGFNLLTTSEKASRYGNPMFADTSWATFNGYPNDTSIAISRDLWGGNDWFVGAQGPPVLVAGDSIAPVVTISSPTDLQSFAIGEVCDIAWTASDAVGVVRVDIDRRPIGPAVTWYTVKHDIITDVTDGSWFWTVANTLYTRTRIRVRAHDAAGNIGEDYVDIVHPCTPCADDDPYYEVP
jgi:hypothetical protein